MCQSATRVITITVLCFMRMKPVLQDRGEPNAVLTLVGPQSTWARLSELAVGSLKKGESANELHDTHSYRYFQEGTIMIACIQCLIIFVKMRKVDVQCALGLGLGLCHGTDRFGCFIEMMTSCCACPVSCADIHTGAKQADKAAWTRKAEGFGRHRQYANRR
jgi:hypothetical protein